jgi:hypothetical protein
MLIEINSTSTKLAIDSFRVIMMGLHENALVIHTVTGTVRLSPYSVNFFKGDSYFLSMPECVEIYTKWRDWLSTQEQ